MTPEALRTPILLGLSGAQVVRVKPENGASWIEKSGDAPDIAEEVAVLRWCAGQLPVPNVLYEEPGLFRMADLPGVPLSELPLEPAARLLAEAIQKMHAVAIDECPFVADWSFRLREAEERFEAGEIDPSDFDKANRGRSPASVLKELQGLPPLPNRRSFTHGDACLENFLADQGQLSGILDLGRAGISHPAQDWALALRDMRSHFGTKGEKEFSRYLPPDCADPQLLRRFRLLDEMF